MKNALMASRHPAYNGAGYTCKCGAKGHTLEQHREHLLLSAACRAHSATNGDLKWVEMIWNKAAKIQKLVEKLQGAQR